MSDTSPSSVMGASSSSPSPAPATTAPADHQEDGAAFPFFELPPELRDCVYDYALLPEHSFRLRDKGDGAEGEDEGETENNEVAVETAQPLPPTSAALQATSLPSTTQQSQVSATAATLTARPTSGRPAIHPSIRCRNDINLSLCNKQVRDEYENRAKLSMTLVLKDNENYAFQLLHLPEQAKQVLFLELHVIFFCHHCQVHPHSGERPCQAALEVACHNTWIVHLLTQLPDLRSLTLQAYLCYDKCGQDKDKAICEAAVKQKIALFYALPKLHSLTLYKYDFQTGHDLHGPKEVMLKWDVREQEVGVKAETDAKVDSAAEECPEKST